MDYERLRKNIDRVCNRQGPRVPDTEREACFAALLATGLEAVLATGLFESCLVHAIVDVARDNGVEWRPATEEPMGTPPARINATDEVPERPIKVRRLHSPPTDPDEEMDDITLQKRGLRRMPTEERWWGTIPGRIVPIPSCLLHPEDCTNGDDNRPCGRPACVFCGK